MLKWPISVSYCRLYSIWHWYFVENVFKFAEFVVTAHEVLHYVCLRWNSGISLVLRFRGCLFSMSNGLYSFIIWFCGFGPTLAISPLCHLSSLMYFTSSLRFHLTSLVPVLYSSPLSSSNVIIIIITIFISVKTNHSTNMIIYTHTHICHAGHEQQV